MFIRVLILTFGLLLGGAVSAQSSEAFLQQVGQENVATVTQMASEAFLLQSGIGNEVTLAQVGGGGHLVRLDQYGGSVAEITQTGLDNRLVGLDWLASAESAALQHDASRLVLEQHGEGNLVLLQQAAGGFAQITQNGTNNTATVIQTGP